MNYWLLASGIFAAFMFVGHSTMGRREFFLPMLDASFDPIAKRAMTFVWHMATVALLLPAAVLIYAGYVGSDATLQPVVLFIGVTFVLWGAVHLYLGLTSGIPDAMKKMFQWAFFMAVGGFALAGVYAG
ncbi:MAG: hypothetical protein HN725_05280 [Alphaproteobacteria bacterium]|jgi:hypothetical protein|nr:hypothetical protein [Alphaproteobacteria bacterium]MBT4085350.1 hypothetical protein [Alphaproteobacteria bacterium]MBT4544123.1 hypothetical protein [Alphaproteobacteria bacterium]MBT6385176.1 hypothetical protein [Alphaproteobacteria bacterium]MBT7744684.1 hypothetical protein [Alphaproteobacteria bacterium]